MERSGPAGRINGLRRLSTEVYIFRDQLAEHEQDKGQGLPPSSLLRQNEYPVSRERVHGSVNGESMPVSRPGPASLRHLFCHVH
jgi:hypothetical protein